MAYNPEAYRKATNKLLGISTQQDEPNAPQGEIVETGPSIAADAAAAINEDLPATQGENAGGGGEYEATSDAQEAAAAAIEDLDVTARNPDEVDDNPGVDPAIQAENEKGALAPFKEAVERTADNPDAFLNQQAQSIRASALYRNYIYTPAEKVAKAREMGKALGMPAGVILEDDTTYKNTQHAYDYYQKSMAVTGSDTLSLKSMMTQFPELRGMHDMDEEELSLVLHDMESVHRIHGLINNALVGWEQGKKKAEHDLKNYKVYEGKANKEQRDQAYLSHQELSNPLNRLEPPEFLDSPLESAVGGAAQSLSMMIEGYKGNVVGGITSALMATYAAVVATSITSGAGNSGNLADAWAFGWKLGAMVGGIGSLSKLTIGESYADKKYQTTKSGMPLYNDNEIKEAATIEGLVNASVENWSNQNIAGLAMPKTALAEKAFKETMAVNMLQANASRNLSAQAKSFVKEGASDFGKALLGEITEEGEQSLTSDLSNNYLVYKTGKGEYVSRFDMARNAFNSSVDAIPTASFLVGTSGAGGATLGINGISRQMFRAYNNGQYNEKSQQTIVGMNLLANLQAAVTDSKLKDLAPDVQKKIIRNEAKDSDFRLVYIDTESALQKETGRDSLQKVADAAGYDSDTLQTAIEQGNLIVPLEVYAQSEADPDLLSSVSFSKEAPSIEQMKRDIQETFTRQNEMMKETIERQKKLMDQITAEYFPNDKEGSDMAAAAIYENAANPAQGLKTIEKRLLDDRDAILKPAMDALTKGGEEEWRKNYKEMFGHNPSKKELLNMATDLMSGFDSAPQIDGWSIDPETSTDVRDKLAAINGRLAVIERTKEKISTLTNAEIKLTEGMTPEAFSVYRTLFSELSKGPGTSSRAARMNAILFARHADNFARVISEKTGRKYTAKNYYQERFALGFDGQQQADAFNQIIGEKGAAELDRKEEVTTRLDNLAVARQMEEAGKDALTIKLATGWERGADKLWKYEIDDNWFALKAFPGSAAWREAFMAHQEVYSPAFYATLDEILLADDLFKAYPALKNVKVKMDELDGAYGEYTTKTEIFTGKKSESGEITLDYGIPEFEVRNVLLHEVQHAIQEIEGFSRGGNKSEFERDYDELRHDLEYIDKYVESVAARDTVFPEFSHKSMAEVEAGKKTIEQHFADIEELKKTDKAHQEHNEALENAMRVKGEIWAAWQKKYKTNVSPDSIYRALIGEVEARNVQRRMSMPWKERQKTLLKDTEDVAREDQIFLRNGGVSMAVTTDSYNLFAILPENKKSQYAKDGADLAAQLDVLREKDKNGTLNEQQLCDICKSPDIFYELGFNGEKFVISAGDLLGVSKSKSSKWHSHYHKIYKNVLKQLPEKLCDPLCIMDSITHKDRVTVVVDIDVEDNNGPARIFVPVEMDKQIGFAKGGIPIKVNFVTTIYGKRNEGISGILSTIITGGSQVNPNARIYYISGDKQRTAPINPDRVQFPAGLIESSSLLRRRVAQNYSSVNRASRVYSQVSTEENTLVGVHNLSAENLRHALKMGGLANPSMAIVDTSKQGLEGYGEITLIAPTPLIDKTSGRNAGTYAADIYSPRYPRISTTMSAESFEKLEKKLQGILKTDDVFSLADSLRDNAQDLKGTGNFMRVFVADKYGIENAPDRTAAYIFIRDNNLNNEYEEYAKHFLDDIPVTERIFNGFTASGKRRYLPHTLENVSKFMKKQGRQGAEGIMYGLGSFRALLTPKATSTKQIKKWKNRLQDTETFKKTKEELEKEFNRFCEIASGNNDWDVGEARLAEAVQLKKDVPSYLESEYGVYMDNDEAADFRAFVKKVAEMPTEYFETKFERPVMIGEFAGAIVPRDLPEDLKEVLRKEVYYLYEYDRGESRTKALANATKELAENRRVLFQQQQDIKGSFSTLSNGQRLIQLFSTADESTFLHEMGHLFLTDLEDLAQIDEVSAKELATVREWATWKKGDYRKYQGTPWSKEFSDLEKSIIAAEEAGDTITAEAQKRRWTQERFARGFEIYLKDGKAPAKGLQAVFRKFASFLRQIYTAFISDGARASADVEAIMARMIATDEEIEAMALDDQFKDIEKAGGEKLLNETERETYERWLNEAKEEAKEKLQKIIMADLTEKKRQEMLKLKEEERAKEYERLEQEPIYLARAIIDKLGGSIEEAMPIILDHCFPDRESFEAADKAAPPIAEAVQQHLEDWQRDYDEQNRKEISEEEVREAMESSVYHRKAKAMESAALSRKLDAKRKITGKVDKAVQNVSDAIDSMPEDTDLKVDKYTKRVKTLIQKVNELRFSTRWNSNDFQHLDRMLKSTTPAEMKELLADFVKNMQQQKLNINDVEKANEGRLKMYAEMARKAAEDKPIYNATNSGEYRRTQRKAESRVLQMIKAGRFELALQQSQHAALSAAMAKEAEKTKEEVDKLIAHINQQLSAKTVKLPAKERYWHKHIAYLLGIGLNDANKPVLPEGQQLGTIQDLLNGYKDRLDLTKDYNADDVLEFITGTAAQQSYVALTVDQLRQAVQLLDIIYKCGKDEFELKTVKGVTIASVVDDILKDEVALAKEMHIKKRRIQDNIGGLGYNGWLNKIPTVGDALAKAGQEYLVIGLKPEKVIELLGKTAYKYIFGTFDEAVNREADMMAKATTDVQNLLKEYSHQERHAWKNRTYKLQLPGEEVELTKENIICMALNLGTEINRQRLIGGLLGPDHDKENGKDTQNLLNFIEDNMTKKDWLFVQSVWDYLHTYWEDTVRVEQELNGMQLQAQPSVPFIVTVDGEVLNMAGGYYPIDYNPDKNDRSSVQAQDDVAKQMGGSAKVLGAGRSHTKSRTEADVFRELQLTFDIIPKHLNQVIHNITTRIAARDVYRLLNHKELSQHITDRLGSPALDMLRKWALDVWTQLPEKDMAANVLEKIVGALRRNSTFAIMAYRIWPVIENSSNYAVLADKLGNINALSALSDFYGNINEYKELLKKSVMMRNRLNNLDRDIRSTPGLFNADHPAIEMIREHGYDLMTFSDLMFSAPLWCRAYKDVFHETLEEVNKENIANKTKVQEAQNNLDKLRGELIEANSDIDAWYAERRNRKNAGQVGWQPGTSRFAVMGHQEFTEQLEELKNQKDELGLKIWEAEAEFGRAIELKILDDAEVVREAEHRAAMKADAVVRDGFGSGRTVDLPAVQRSYSELVKAMTSFYSFFNTVFNSIYFSYIQSRYGNRPAPNAGTWDRAKQWAPLARTVMYRIFLLSAIGSVLKMATKTDGDDDRDKYRKVMKDGKEVKEEIPWLQRFLKVFAKNSLGTATGSLYGVRDLANVAMNLAFDGTDFGRGVNIVSTPLRSVEEGIRTIKLIAAKSERDAKIEARKQQEAAKLKKMTAKQRRKYLEEQKYKKPLYPITYTEIFRHAANAITGFTATKTGVSSTIIDSVTGTMQYLLDTDNRYNATWRNIIWSAIFDKKPVEKTPPEKPEKKKQKKPRQ